MKTKITLFMSAMLIGILGAQNVFAQYETVYEVYWETPIGTDGQNELEGWVLDYDDPVPDHGWQGYRMGLMIWAENEPTRNAWAISPKIDASGTAFVLANLQIQDDKSNGGYQCDLYYSTGKSIYPGDDGDWTMLAESIIYRGDDAWLMFDPVLMNTDTITGSSETYFCFHFHATDDYDAANDDDFRFMVKDFIVKSDKSQVSIGENNVSDLGIYPNPVSNVLNIDVNNAQSIEIINTIGQIVLSIENPLTSIDVSNLEVGQYIVKVKKNNETLVNKFLKK